MPLTKDILCTVGPASLNPSVLGRLNDLPVTLLRINLSHTPLDALPDTLRFIKKHTRIPICIDTEGAQIRTQKLAEREVIIRENSLIKIHRRTIRGDAQNIGFYPPESFALLRAGDLVAIDFNSALVQVVKPIKEGLLARVITEGKVGSNKAVAMNRPVPLPPLTRKDRAAIAIAVKSGIRHFALSFANRFEDVNELRRLAGRDCHIIAKIESSLGVRNLQTIAGAADALLIDRGDLAREEPIESIPLLQKHIIKSAKKHPVKVYVATNLLDSMQTQAKPTRAEVSDIINILLDGADGLVLAAETAIGKNAVGCVNMIAQLIHQYENYSRYGIRSEKYETRSLLIEPHGGTLTRQIVEQPDSKEIRKLLRLAVNERVVLDCEQIAHGVYSPLRGFMNREEMESVLDNNRLPGGLPWTLPILFQMPKTKTARLAPGQTVALTEKADPAKPFALLEIQSLFQLDFQSVARRLYGTASVKHPGVRQLRDSGDILVSGKTSLIRTPHRPDHIAPNILSPHDTRMIFEQKNWYRVVGFHTRNVIHRAHEFIQLKALNDYHCDGLFISPVVGPRKSGDFTSQAVLKSYQIMLDCRLYPSNKALLGAFLTYPRYAGPREAVFTALCRKNFGCTHFIVGRDHTGVHDFYPPEAARRIFETIGDIGIVPVFFDSVGYCLKCRDYREKCEKHPARDTLAISGSLLRDKLLKERELPHWLVREEIAKMLLKDHFSGKPVFVK